MVGYGPAAVTEVLAAAGTAQAVLLLVLTAASAVCAAAGCFAGALDSAVGGRHLLYQCLAAGTPTQDTTQTRWAMLGTSPLLSFLRTDIVWRSPGHQNHLHSSA